MSLINWRQWIHEQDLYSDLRKHIIDSHEKLHCDFFGLKILQPLINIAHTLTASALRKWTKILKLIPQDFKLSEVISKWLFSLMNLSNLLLDIENLGAISLTECVLKLSPNLKSSISVNDTTLKFWWYWFDNLSTNYIISTNPYLNSCWRIHEWRRNGYRTIYKTKLIFAIQRFPHWPCLSRIIFFSDQRLRSKNSPWIFSRM